MARAYPIASQSEGINLLRSKGGASAGALFDLVNGYVTAKRTINARPGAVRAAAFAAGTKGMVGFEGKFHTFTSDPTLVSVDPTVRAHLLRRSTAGSATLSKVHNAFPFLGRLYVVAEFDDGGVQHFWLEEPASRTNSTIYAFGSKVQPITPNGFYYEIATPVSIPTWTANSAVNVGDYRVPSAGGNLKMKATAVQGPAGAQVLTGNTEPTWPTVEGGTFTERRYITDTQLLPGLGLAPTPTAPGGTSPDTPAGSEYGPFPTRDTKLSSV